MFFPTDVYLYPAHVTYSKAALQSSFGSVLGRNVPAAIAAVFAKEEDNKGPNGARVIKEAKLTLPDRPTKLPF